MIKINFNSLFLILISFIPTLLFSQVDTAWVRRYNGPGNDDDIACAVAIDANGNVYVTGRSYGSGTYFDYATLKYDRNGNLLWERRYNGPGNRQDEIYAMVIDNEGNVYVTGRSRGSENYDYLTIKYDTEGNELWVKRHNGPGNGSDCARAITIDNEGNVYVTGYATGLESRDYLTIKYDANGNELWVRTYNGPGNGEDIACKIVVDKWNNVYVTGYSWGFRTSYDYATIKYDVNGNELWVRRYNGPAYWEDKACAIALDTFGNVYVTGYSVNETTFYDYLTIKYDGEGNELWRRRYNGPGNIQDRACAIAVDNFGNVYVTGTSYDSGTNDDYVTIKYDTEGNELWIRKYNGLANGDDTASAITLDNFNNVYVTGISYNFLTDYDCLTIKYDTNGNELWVRSYNGLGNGRDVSQAIAVDNLGNIYITGGSEGIGSELDYVTIKYVERTDVSENKILKEKVIFPEKSKIYSVSGELIKEKKLKKGIYFLKTEKYNKKILILK